MLGALPKIWPWKTVEMNNGKEVFSNVSPADYAGEPHVLSAIFIMGFGALILILMERFVEKNK